MNKRSSQKNVRLNELEYLCKASTVKQLFTYFQDFFKKQKTVYNRAINE